MILRVATIEHQTNPLTWWFLLAFAGSCVLFWWLQSILLHFWLRMELFLEPRFIWISIVALTVFSMGYLLPPPRWLNTTGSRKVLDRCQRFAYQATVLWAVPAFLVALRFTAYRFTVSYGEGQGISLIEQAVLYIHLFLGLLYISVVDDDARRIPKVGLIIFLTIAPRLLISLRWGRFFAAQAIVPILFIAIARGWLKITCYRMLQLLLLSLFILFVPALTRGDNIFGQDEYGNPQIVNYFGYMNSLGFFQENTDIVYTCPPLLVSLTAKIFPYSVLSICTIDIGDDKNMIATLDNLLTKRYTDNMRTGTGSNYLLELYLTGGITAIIIGSLFFGFSCRTFVGLMGKRSLYAGIWAECLSRALFAPRATLGLVYERIPSLLLATWAVIVVSWAIQKLGTPSAWGNQALTSPSIRPRL